ncbi:hypothetical protein [Mucilaginibacter antarcticus]
MAQLSIHINKATALPIAIATGTAISEQRNKRLRVMKKTGRRI